MSWVSRHQTTRPEDIVYCLIGIFNVNMPLLYGKGNKAFIRLQHEIIKTSDNQTIFAWKDKEAGYRNFGGLLATSPDYFSHARGLFALPNLQRPISVPSELTNKGLCVEMILIGSEAGSVTVRAPVAIDKSRLLGHCYSIILQHVTSHGDQYSCVQADTLDKSIRIGSNTRQFIINRKVCSRLMVSRFTALCQILF